MSNQQKKKPASKKKAPSKKKELKQTTNKAQRLLLKQQKKFGLSKNISERQAEVEDVKTQLEKYGIDTRFSAVRELHSQMDKFVVNGESISGQIDFPEAPPNGRIIDYSFPTLRGNKCTCNLLVKENKNPFMEFAEDDMEVPQLVSEGVVTNDTIENEEPEKIEKEELEQEKVEEPKKE